MKVKEIGRTANIAWSPHQQHPIYMVAGTAAQQLDATFRFVTFWSYRLERTCIICIH